jgi:hypothetical protein
MAFPSVLTTFTTPNPTDKLSSPSHSGIETAQNDAISQLERVVGTSASTLGTIIGDLRNTTSAGGGHVQTAVKGGTGQTTFTKGDILAAQSASVIGKLGIGANDTVLIADSAANLGVKWGAAPTIAVSSVTNTGTSTIASVWTKPTAAGTYSRTFVQLWGGGGSGGHGDTTYEVGGGGGGGYAEGWFMSSVLSASVLLNVGRGGISQNTGVGVAGTKTVFDVQASLLTAYAGGGGTIDTTGAGGGGGGGAFEDGGDGSSDTGGAGGDVFGGTGGDTNVVGSVAYLGAGGGGDAQAGGAAYWGGGGGGGVKSSGMGVGGTSRFGGAGSAGSVITAGSVLAGTTPAGGGGGGYGAGSSGQGGGGQIIITTFL